MKEASAELFVIWDVSGEVEYFGMCWVPSEMNDWCNILTHDSFPGRKFYVNEPNPGTREVDGPNHWKFLYKSDKQLKLTTHKCA